MGNTIGIELGSVYARVATTDNGTPVLIANADGQKATPSVVTFSKDGKLLVGDAAKKRALTSPERVIGSITRKMGTDFAASVDDKSYTPQHLSAMILRSLKQDAEHHFGSMVESAVIAVPGYYGISERLALQQAAQIAGLDRVTFISRPVAAALAWGIQKDAAKRVLVVDMAGGTFDVSVIESSNEQLKVLATGGDNCLGAQDFDDRIVEWMADIFEKDVGIDLRADKVAMERMREAAESAKIALSDQIQTNIHIPFITVDDEGPQHLSGTLTREQFNDLTPDLVERARDITLGVMQSAQIEPSQIDNVIMAGGGSYVPAVRAMIADIAGRLPQDRVAPEECVAMGAALLSGPSAPQITDVMPLALRIGTGTGIVEELLAANTPLPASVHKTVQATSTQGFVRILQGDAQSSEVAGTIPAAGELDISCDIDAQGLPGIRATSARGQIAFCPTGSMSAQDVEQAAFDVAQALKDRDQFSQVVRPVRTVSSAHAKRMYGQHERFQERFQVARANAAAPISIPVMPAPDPLEDAVLAVLPVLDNLERAVAMSTQDTAYAQGIQMITRQFHDALESLGVRQIDTSGQFDPHLHHAIMQVEDASLKSNQIAETVQKGYTLKGKVVRPATVKVAK